MANSIGSLLLVSLAFFILPAVVFGQASRPGCFKAIFSFGDSLSDDGNVLSMVPTSHVGKNPYGMTFFGRPTGRFSDGRIVPDFIAEAAGLPFLPPFYPTQNRTWLRQGANFAVSGAAALDNSYFTQKGLTGQWTTASLGAQLQSFQQLLPSLCSSRSDCLNFMGKSLFLVGEFGGNDYGRFFFGGKLYNEIKAIVPQVVDTIASAINTLIKLGAKTMVVPSILPIGCNASYLTRFRIANARNYYDPKTGCIKWINEFAKYHRDQLRSKVQQLQSSNPGVTIIFADYYEATMSMIDSPQKFGFNNTPLMVCCGAGGQYNLNPAADCGILPAKACSDPSKYLWWDAWHLTEAAYKIISNGLLRGPYANPPILNACRG